MILLEFEKILLPKTLLPNTRRIRTVKIRSKKGTVRSVITIFDTGYSLVTQIEEKIVPVFDRIYLETFGIEP